MIVQPLRYRLWIWTELWRSRLRCQQVNFELTYADVRKVAHFTRLAQKGTPISVSPRSGLSDIHVMT